MPNHLVFYSGIKKNENNQFITDGGRVLINVVLSNNLEDAAKIATKACFTINFEGAQFRKDIGLKAFKK